MTFNVSFIHKNLALRWLLITNDFHDASIREYTLKSDIDEVIDSLAEEQVDVVGLSVYIFNHEKSKQFIVQLKERMPHIRVIVGGPEPTYQVKDWLECGADAVVRGEGEFAFWDFVNKKEHPGVATRSHMMAQVIASDLKQLEKAGNPYFLDIDQADQANRYLYLEASRGCPFSCTYCMAGIEHGVRYFSLDYIKDIIQKIEHSHVRSIKFLDRTFNVHPKRALEIIRMLNDIRRDVSIQLELEVSIWDQALHDFFIEHGKRDRFRFEIGVQTFSEKTLNAVKRNQDNEMVEHVITTLSAAGYVVHADLIAGLPYEDADEFIHSFHRLFEIAPVEIQLGILKGLPGTLLFEQSQSLGMIFDSIPPYTIIENPWMSKSDLLSMEWAALGVEKTYNRPIGKTLAKLIYQKTASVFNYFKQVGYNMSQLSHPYQLSDVITIMINEGQEFLPKEMVIAAVATDMGVWNKLKPKGLPYFNHSELLLKKMINNIEVRSKQKQDQWRSNSWVYSAIVNGELGYQWIVYPQGKRYYYDEGAVYVKEETHFISNK